MKKLLVILCMILAMLICFAACRGDDDAPESNNESNEITHQHTPSDWIIDGEVSCNTNGNRHIECIECHEILQSEIAYAEGHKMKNGVCTVCGKTFSSGLEFTSLGSGKCYVSGIGECNDSELFIPPTSPEGEKVVYIGENAFRERTGITGVEISEGITSIGRCAFIGCSDINNVFLPKTLVVIDDYAFTECKNLQTVRLGEALTEIGFEAFGYCSKLHEIAIPDGVTQIHNNAFLGCSGLKTISFGKESKLNSIGDRAFYECTSLEEIILPESLTEMGTTVFNGCTSLKTVVIGSGLKVINSYTFTECSSLEWLELGKVEKIGFEAFGYCDSLKDIFIPQSVISIHNNAFLKCMSLESVQFDKNSKLETIGEDAFRGCEALAEIAIPDSTVTIGKCAFYDCKALKKAVIGNGVEIIDDYAFSNCESLVELTLGESLQEIRFEAFGYCYALNNLTLPESLWEIHDNAFLRCKGLEKLDFSFCKNLGRIGQSAFASCTSLTEAILPECLILLEKSAFSNCMELTRAVICGNVVRIDDYAFNECKKLSTLEIKEGVDTIGFGAFSDCTSLESVVIPDGLYRIERQAFMGCYDLTSIVLPESITYLGNAAFSLSGEDRIYYFGNENKWRTIDFDVNNEYLSSHTPYYYVPFDAPYDGDYWGYNDKGEIIVWGLTADAFMADRYCKDFFEECIGEQTLGNLLLGEIEAEMMDTIRLWESLHIIERYEAVLDPEKKVITKQDLYTYVLYDLLTGEHADESFADAFESASANLFFDVARVFLGEFTMEDLKIGDVASVLKNLNEFSISEAVLKEMTPDVVDTFVFIMNLSENAYEATQYISRYYALRNIKEGYISILEEIVNYGGTPEGLRLAAQDLILCYNDAFNMTPEEFVETMWDVANTELLTKEIRRKSFDFMKKADPTGWLTLVDAEEKIVLSVMEVLGINEMVNSYYKLDCLVALERAVLSDVKFDAIDYYKYENRDASSLYMSYLSLFKEIVILENRYCIKFFTDYYTSLPSDESPEEFQSLIYKIIDKNDNYCESFEKFDKNVKELFEIYYVMDN